MDFKTPLVKRAAVWLIVGLIGVGITADQWQRRQAARDLAEVTSWQAGQLQDARAKIEELAKALDAERQRREALEGGPRRPAQGLVAFIPPPADPPGSRPVATRLRRRWDGM